MNFVSNLKKVKFSTTFNQLIWIKYNNRSDLNYLVDQHFWIRGTVIIIFSQFFFSTRKKVLNKYRKKTIWTILKHNDFVKTKALCCGPVKLYIISILKKRNIWIIMNTYEKKTKIQTVTVFLIKKSLYPSGEKKSDDFKKTG